ARCARGDDECGPPRHGPGLPAGDRVRTRGRDSRRQTRGPQQLPLPARLMLRPLLRRDRAPGRAGFFDAVIGPMVIVLTLTGVAAALYTDNSLSEIILIFGINAIMVVGFQTFVGSTGIVSFGHVAFMAIGAYATAVAAIAPADKSYILPRLPRFLEHLQLGVIPSLLVG